MLLVLEKGGFCLLHKKVSLLKLSSHALEPTLLHLNFPVCV